MKIRASIKQFPSMIDAVRQARDKYKSDYEKVLTVRNDAEQVLPKRFIGEELKRQKAAIEAEFNREISNVKNRFMDSVIKSTSEVEKEIIGEVSRPFSMPSIMQFLKDSIAISKTEFEILRDSFGGTYWADRLLAEVATRNGIDNIDTPANADTLLSVIRSVREESQQLVDEWKGDNADSSPMTRMILHDKHLSRWEDLALKGVNAQFTKQQRATRVLSALNGLNSNLERILAISNAMRNLEDAPDVAQLVLYGISQSDKLYEAGVVPFLDQDYADAIREYHTGKLKPSTVKEDEESDTELSDAEQETARVLSELAQQKEEVNARRRAALAEATVATQAETAQ